MNIGIDVRGVGEEIAGIEVDLEIEIEVGVEIDLEVEIEGDIEDIEIEEDIIIKYFHLSLLDLKKNIFLIFFFLHMYIFIIL